MEAQHTPKSAKADYWRERSRRRRQDPEYRAKQAQVYKAWYEANGRTPERLARRAELGRSYAKAERKKELGKIHRMVRAEIEAGRLLKQPCEVCGATEAHAHHDDYTKPLDVRWLCPLHHRQHHNKATGQ